MLSNFSQRLEKLFLLFLIINPFFDVFTGVYIRIGELLAGESVTGLITPTLILRMLLLLIFAVYALVNRDKPIILTILPMLAAWALTVVGEFLFAPMFSLFTELQYFAKFIYNSAVILIYWRVFQHCGLSKQELLQKINWVLCFSLLLLASTIWLSYLFDIGYTTYTDRWGPRGTRGFFYSGNDITGVLMLLLPLAMACYMQMETIESTRRQRLFYQLAPAMGINGLILIGTKTAFIAILGVVLAMLGYALWRWRKDGSRLWLKRLGWIGIGTAALFGVLMLASEFMIFLDLSEMAEKLRMIFDSEDLVGVMFSGRTVKLQNAFSDLLAASPYQWLFGIGRGSQNWIIEMDLFEVIIYYGPVGAVALLWIYFKLGFSFIRKFFRQVDLFGYALFLAIGLCFGYAALAGHVLFSVTSGFYFAFLLVYAQLYYAESPQSLELFARKKDSRK